MKKRIALITGLLMAFAFALGAFLFVPVSVEGTTQTPSLSRNNAWRGRQWFRKQVWFYDSETHSGTETHSGAVTFSGVVTNTSTASHSDGVFINDEITFEPYQHISATGALTWAYSYGNILMLSGTTPITVTLPTITSAYSGYKLTIKNESGATTRTITAASGVDAIEATQGTMSGSSDTAIDAAGDYSTYVAMHTDYLAGASSVWMLLDETIQ